ncbi:MAG: hypothetical protein DWQ37_00840 [Planctomycetota bacterium]|nr:MAG: hypothetical protein DWQ37_00840 [Planctomycetota bacterium]
MPSTTGGNPAPRPDGASRLNRLYQIAFYLSAMFLAFVAGAVATDLNWAVGDWARDAFLAARAVTSGHLLTEDEYPKLLWNVARTDARGLRKYDPRQSAGGYTLYSAADSPSAILLDERGDELHRWTMPLSRACPNAPVSRWVADRGILVRRTQLFPNGDLMALYDTPQFTPSGCGLVRMDCDSEVIWAFDEPAHHDFAVDPAGNTWVLTNAIRRTAHPQWQELELPIIEEFVVKLDPQGHPVQRMSLFDLLGSSRFHRPLVSLANQLGDVLHSNTVNLAGEKFAAHHPDVSHGDLIVCLRNLNLVVAINPDRAAIVWAVAGPWRRPHDPDPLDNGHLLVFDNCYAGGSVEGSRVVEVDPRDASIVWAFTGTGDDRLYSQIRSSQQRLPGGNVLITESDFGRILEVTRDGQVVWEYVHPGRGTRDGQTLIPVICGAQRYDPQQLDFLDRQPSAVAKTRADQKKGI